MSQQDAEMQKFNTAIERYADDLMTKANVVGVGVGMRKRDGEFTDEKALVVLVSEKKPVAQLADEDVIPTELDGIPIDVQETGVFTA